jgi:hypothetical protein
MGASHLTPLLRGIIFIGEAPLGTGFDFGW